MSIDKMRPALLFPDDASCGASDVAVNGEHKTFIIKSDNSSSAVSVYLLSEPKGTSSKSAAADEKGTPEAREIWKRMEIITAEPGKTGEYVTDKLCHCCRKVKPTGVQFHCGKHTYCSSHFDRRLGTRQANDIYHCPVCILTCTCLTCNERLMALTQIMKSECKRQDCGPSEVRMNNLFELCTTTSSNFASIAKCTYGPPSKQAEETFTFAMTSKSSTGSKSKGNLDKLWYENLERLKTCIVNGKMDYSGLTDEKDKKQLSDFVYRQRQYFRMRKNNEDSPLTNERFEALSALNFPFEVQRSTNLSGAKSSSKKNVIVSLKDQSYKQIMEEYFKKLGPKTNQTKEGKLTEREAADAVFNELESKGGRFVRLMNSHNLSEGYVEIDDDEAWNSKYLILNVSNFYFCGPYHLSSMLSPFCLLEEIRCDINRRMESAKRWLYPKSSSKDSSSATKQPKRRKEDTNGERKTKRQHKSTDQDEKRNENPSQMKEANISISKGSVKGCPLEYVGNYIANHLEGWEAQQRTNKLGLDYFVIHRHGFNKKTAVEGKDKFAGYDELAKWAFRTGYYTKHVVETKEGKEILERLGIENEPYSIFNFNESANENQSGIHAQQENQSSFPQAPWQQQIQESGGATRRIMERQEDLAGSHVESPQNSGAESNSNSKPVEAKGLFAGFKRFRQTASNLKSLLASAQERGDELGINFYGHLDRWLRLKSNDTDFVMQFRSDDIDEAVEEFRSVMEQIKSAAEGTTETFKNLVDILIDQARKIFSA